MVFIFPALHLKNKSCSFYFCLYSSLVMSYTIHCVPTDCAEVFLKLSFFSLLATAGWVASYEEMPSSVHQMPSLVMGNYCINLLKKIKFSLLAYWCPFATRQPKGTFHFTSAFPRNSECNPQFY